jgi:hypothetical protein
MESFDEVEATFDYFPELQVLAEQKEVKGAYVQGPIPIAWIRRVDTARHTYAAASVIKMRLDITGEEPVRVPGCVWRELGWARNTRDRALDALERVGIIRTERPRGKPIQIWLLDKP